MLLARIVRPVRGEPLPLRMCATSITVEVDHRRGNSPMTSIERVTYQPVPAVQHHLRTLYSRQFTFTL